MPLTTVNKFDLVPATGHCLPGVYKSSSNFKYNEPTNVGVRPAVESNYSVCIIIWMGSGSLTGRLGVEHREDPADYEE